LWLAEVRSSQAVLHDVQGEKPALPTLFTQLVFEAIHQFGANLGNFHARAHQEFAAQEIVRAVFIRKLSNDAAILAILIPAESAVGDGFRTEVLKAAKNRILLGNLKRLPHNFDFHQPFVRTKNLRGPT
jgi:hypothetical protein